MHFGYSGENAEKSLGGENEGIIEYADIGRDRDRETHIVEKLLTYFILVVQYNRIVTNDIQWGHFNESKSV